MTATHTNPELNGRQRFELAMLGDELDNLSRSYEVALADIIRFVAAERITYAHFTKRDKQNLTGGYLAALLVEQPGSFPAGETAGRALLLAGFTPGDATHTASPSLN